MEQFIQKNLLAMSFDENKSTALSLFFIDKMKKEPLSHIKLIKLLYLTDRLSLKAMGTTITKDNYVAMKYGPVLSNVLSLIRDDEFNYADDDTHSVWSDHIDSVPTFDKKTHKRLEIKVKSKKDEKYNKIFITSKLDGNELNFVTRIYEDFFEYDQWQLIDYTHYKCKEWTHPYPFGVQPIFIKDIIKSLKAEKINDRKYTR